MNAVYDCTTQLPRVLLELIQGCSGGMSMYVKTIAKKLPRWTYQGFTVSCPFRGFIHWVSVFILCSNHALTHALRGNIGVSYHLVP
eukprot:6828328-Lingulodinium_polyedra.AAC.1